jgi:hypothetical protein
VSLSEADVARIAAAVVAELARLGALPESIRAPVAAPTPVPVDPDAVVSGATIVKAQFTVDELERLDARRGAVGRSDWSRAVVLAAVRAGKIVHPVAPVGGHDSRFVNFRLSAADVAALDVARGSLSRSSFIRASVLGAIA